MTVFTKDPASPELIAEFKKKGSTLVQVTMTRLYLIEGNDGRPIEDLIREWFVKYRGSSHAYRDGSHIGGSDKVQEVKVLTEEGRVIFMNEETEASRFNSRVVILAAWLADDSALCGLCESWGDNAAEMETIIAQTIRACAVNLRESGQSFAYNFIGGGGIAGLVDNGSALDLLVTYDYLKKGLFKSRATILPTNKLVVELENRLGIIRP